MARSARPKTYDSALCDDTDRIIAEWKLERPGLFQEGTALVGRIRRLALHMESALVAGFKRFGLSHSDYDVLSTLRRRGTRVSQKELMNAVLRTSGTLTFRIDSLEKRGLVQRIPDPADRRGMLVVLTDKGRKLYDRAQPSHTANKEIIFAPLGDAEREQLAAIMRHLLLCFERDEIAELAQVNRSLVETFGLVVAAGELLEPVRGPAKAQSPLLVRWVRAGSPSGYAGLLRDDRIVSVDGLPVAAALDFKQALAARAKKPIVLVVRRGTRALTLKLNPPRGAGARN